MNRFCRNVGLSMGCAALAGLGVAGSASAQVAQLGKPMKGTIVDTGVNEGGTPDGASAGQQFQPRGPGNGCAINAATCQERGGANVLVVNEPRSSNRPFASYTVADNFQLSANANLTSICWWGYYGPGGVNTPPPAAGNEGFHIVLYTNNTGVPSGVVATWDVGANFLVAGDVLTPGTTLTRHAGLGTPSSLPGATIYSWTATIPPQALTAGTGYWLEISASSATLGDGSANDNRWRWIDATSAPTGEQVCLQAPSASLGTYTFSNIVSSPHADRAFCLGLSTAATLVTCNCQIPPPAPNNSCANSIAITPGTTLTNVATYRSIATSTPFCGTSAVATPTLWYHTTGDGTTFTADTCGANAPATFDTVINVYCTTAVCGANCSAACGASNSLLYCVANNDDSAVCGTGSLHSSVSWPTVNGRNYIIAVFAYSNQVPAVGSLDFALASDGVQANNTAACVSDRCPVDLALVPAANLESAGGGDVCGVSTNSACDGAGVRTFVLNQTYGGTSYNTGALRDFDYWHYAGPALTDNGNPGVCWLLCTYEVEFPGLFAFYTGPCTAGAVTGIGAALADYRQLAGDTCPRPAFPGAFDRGVLVNAASGTDFWVNPIINEFGGVPCATGNNNYKFNVTLATVGSCCQPGLVCAVNPQGVCLATAGSIWSATGACSPTDPCNGACCNGAVCTITTFDGCVGGTFTGGQTACTPSFCVPPPSGVCCRGATCTTTVTTAAACTASLISGGTAGAAFPTGATCNVGNVSSTPCCYANYNKVNGVTVADIFDFLTDWFAGSPYANTGGNGTAGPLAVGNIFDFLTNWFNGGCN